MPLDDEEGYYIFGDCIVDINDSWIDRNAVSCTEMRVAYIWSVIMRRI